MLGKKTWMIPDGYLPPVSNGGVYVSHEAICVLNAGNENAKLEITIFFEDTDPMEGFFAECAARRTNHIHLESLVNGKGESVPVGVPYAILLQSSVPVVAQHSRLDTTQAELTLMTTMGYGI
jgi:hypothetical protein